MAILNIERLEQLKKENEIKKGVYKTAFAMWVDNINDRTKAMMPFIVDIIDTFS